MNNFLFSMGQLAISACPRCKSNVFIWWLAFFLYMAVPGKLSQDRERAQKFLENQTKDTHHLKEHLMEEMGLGEEAADRILNETSNEVQFFLMHDYDNNSKLDGLEILHGLFHHHHSHEEGRENSSIPENEFADFVDTILADQDYDDDGFIDYPEFVRSFRQDRAGPE